MSTDINQITIVGRLTKDAEMRYTSSGTALCTFSIACNEDVKQSSGQWEEKAHFFDCTLWGKSAESLNQYLVKGKQVAIVGRLKQDRWEDRDSGQNRSKVSINVFTLQLLQDPANSGQRGDYYDQQPPRGQQAPTQGRQQRPQQEPQYAVDRRYDYYQPPAPKGDFPPPQGAQMTFAGPETFVDDNIPF